MHFGRIVTAMVTPFDDNLRIDYGRLEKVVEHLLRTGTESIVVSGTTGESPTLSHEEKLALFKKVVELADGRAKVIAGTGSNNTAASVNFSKEAEQCGVDGLLVVAPYYNRPSQEGLYRHFKAIAEATPLPNMIYNVPTRTSSNINVQTQLQLAEIPNIVATKEASEDFGQVLNLLANAPANLTVYAGNDRTLLPFLALGGYGVVSVASHVVGLQIKELIDSFVEGQLAKATLLHNKLLPIFEGLFQMPSPAPVKAALSLIGVPAGGVRLPLVEADEKTVQSLRTLLSDWHDSL
ncbi:4-hydroxy-tetrahydrodipicolinate synthase [Effusibacillus lacus]|uniref:4-hydroxy-tetrahydrodipicolinate synthase n=1 Tax=Effusibacillus lacus TaxID=1348429 RepID=A0A292YQ07_9BACL|nr:4-hydroxy-tetrahydrodipicolinate synthase [Effusibacillus lacus]TCS73181.1 dihydrodipicolinate synthase [Effusibacillus lacus]GAX90585.1 4-hydroxy-tetrahydrodipicolinate synthase [Effusibacillus lacus]